MSDNSGILEEVLRDLEIAGGKKSEFKGMFSVNFERKKILEAIGVARDHGFNHLSDIFGIDYGSYPGHQGSRFTVSYNLYAIAEEERLFLRVDLDESEELPTLTGLWKGANFMEREVFDMFGISFQGHPNLRKIITPEDLDGHPHRKDFPLDETATLFNEGRFLDPAAFRAGIMGRDPGLTGWAGGARKGVRSAKLPSDDTFVQEETE